MKLKNKDLFRIKQGLDNVSKFKGVKFAYAIAKNKRIVISELVDLQKAAKMSDEFKKYEDKRIVICTKYAKKDENGEFVYGRNKSEYVIEKRDMFDKEIETLQLEHKESIDARESQLKEYEKLLDSESVPIEFHKILFEYIPEDITGEQIEAIMELIDDEIKEIKKVTEDKLLKLAK